MDWRDIKEFIKDAFKYIVVIICVLIVAIYVVSFVQVVGPSMEPNYTDGEVLIISKFHYKVFDVKRNDIISFESEGVRYLIKRVIGLPGETIEYKNNILYINGVGYEESIVEGLVTNDFKLKDLGYDVIPDGMYLVLGDNRNDSYDSRDFGLITDDQIIGKCLLRFWPLSKFKII